MHTSIQVTDLELYGFHGFYDEEQRLGQKFLFNIRADLASASSHLDDNFAASIRYDQLIAEIESMSNEVKFRTLEALGESIARGLIRRFDRINNVVVTVSKASAPITQSLQRVSVTIQLDR